MIYLALTTVPDRISNQESYKKVLDSLIAQHGNHSYKVLLSIPNEYKNYGKYDIDPWLVEYQERNNEILEIIRDDIDYGPITNLLYPIKHVNMSDDDIIIICDDDHIYHEDMIITHMRKLEEYPENHSICFRGNHPMELRTWKHNNKTLAIFANTHATFPVKHDIYLKLPDHWHSVSYRRRFIKDDIFDEDFLNTTWNNDILMGIYAITHDFYFLCTSQYDEEDFRPVNDYGRGAFSFPIKETASFNEGGCYYWRKNEQKDIWENEEFTALFDKNDVIEWRHNPVKLTRGIKTAIGEVADRYSICKLKSERLHLDNSKELNELKHELDRYNDIQAYVNKLYETNGNIWDLEADIRQGKIDELGYEEIGRRAIKIRDFNNIRVSIKNEINSLFKEGYSEIKMNHGSEKYKSVIITLSTVPQRLSNPNDHGIKEVIKSLCEQNDNDYEVHFNIPEIYNVTKERYVIPDWLNDYKLTYPHLKVFRPEDIGPPTKFVPTLTRINDPETILIVVDDDLVYHPNMVTEHRKYQNQLTDSVICYDGRGTPERKYNDNRDSFVLCVTEVRKTDGIQHYKSASYKKRLFDEDFLELYLGKTLSDDVLVSKYFKNKKIEMFVVPYEPETPLYETLELWEQNHGVETFPVVKHANAPSETGCNHPEILKIQPKFYEPPTLGTRIAEIKHEVPVVNKVVEPVQPKYETVPQNIIQLLNVYDVNSPKIRLGHPHDGGYVLNELVLRNAQRLITFGMGMEDTFELEWARLYPDKPIEAYDGTYPCNDLCRHNEELVNKSIFYVNHNIGYNAGEIPANVVLDDKPNVLLKVDIEGAEYSIFENVSLENISGLIIEIHDLHEVEYRNKFIELFSKFDNLLLYHIHANSWGGTFDLDISKSNRGSIVVKDFPTTLELSFVNKSLVSKYELEHNAFPDISVDTSNNKDLPDIDLPWVNAL